MKTKTPYQYLFFVLLLVVFFSLFLSNCNRTTNKAILSNKSILKNDTLTYSIIEWIKWMDNGKNTTLEIGYNILENQKIEAGAKLKLLTTAPDFVKTMEIKEGELHIESAHPFGGKIDIIVCPKKGECDSFFVQLIPCSRAEYHHYPGMPIYEESFYLTGDSVLNINIESYLRPNYKGTGSADRKGNQFVYKASSGFVGVEEFWFFGKLVYSPCGGYWDVMEGHKVYVAPIDELNKAPIAVNDTFYYQGTKAHLVFPLNNDYDTDEGLKEFGHEVLSIVSLSKPKHGRTQHLGKISFHYIPSKEKLPDEIEYVVRDINGKTAKGIILIQPK